MNRLRYCQQVAADAQASCVCGTGDAVRALGSATTRRSTKGSRHDSSDTTGFDLVAVGGLTWIEDGGVHAAKAARRQRVYRTGQARGRGAAKTLRRTARLGSAHLHA